MADYRIHSHMYYDEKSDGYRLSLWTLHANGEESMSLSTSMTEHDLELLAQQMANARGQKACYVETPIKETPHV
jgi:hypothetical protein